MTSIFLVKNSDGISCYTLKNSKPVDLFLKERNKNISKKRWVILEKSSEKDLITDDIRKLFDGCFTSRQKKFNVEINKIDIKDLEKIKNSNIIYWDQNEKMEDSDTESEDTDTDSDTESEDSDNKEDDTDTDTDTDSDAESEHTDTESEDSDSEDDTDTESEDSDSEDEDDSEDDDEVHKPSQKDVEKKAEEIKKKVKNKETFLYKNYEILLKKNINTKLERILIDDCIKKTLSYKSPEQIDLNVETICFYMALKQLGVNSKEW